MENKKEFRLGLVNAIPVCLGYLAVSFAFGIQASEAGLSVFQASLMSLSNVTSAGQFSSLDLISTNATYAEMALLQLVVNIRYMLMSTALSQKLSPKIGTLSRCLVAYGVTDEIFALSVTRKGRLNPAYSYGLIICSVFGWVMGTFLGAFAGSIMPHRLISALGLAIYGMFLAIVIPDAREKRPIMLVVIGSMVMSTIFTYAPGLKNISSGFRIIIVTIVIAGVAAVLAPKKEEETADA
ncbi:AzlC family ABC transporter permease [Butyrivibrio sp. AE3004]|uniref:AzlC family ABC transporter permease n=1 Tax=Butyrivibrio sp. AE3004 TaxID=1506994 RepID=UPI0004946858|nr:AzlC family ABC transporter permease [Butyrivibrio sp. AE3004]